MTGELGFRDDKRPWITVDWFAGDQEPRSEDFLIDSGATQSCVTSDAGIRMEFLGAKRIETAAGISSSVILGNGKMQFDVFDRTADQVITATFAGPFLLQGRNIMGEDALHTVGVAVTLDHTVKPAVVRLER